MFQATVKADVVKHIIDATLPLVQEAKIQISKDGISLRAVDPAHVAMVELSIGAKAFESFEGSDLELGLDLDKFKDILKLAGASDTVRMEYKKDSHRLVFTMGKLVRRMSLVDTASLPDPKVPNLNLPNKVTMQVDELLRALKGCETVSDHIQVTVDKEGFKILAEGDQDSLDLNLAKEDLVSLEAAEKTRSMYSLDYFLNMAKAVKTGENVTLNLGTDYPVKIEFDMAGGGGHCVYLLAPRIESD